MPGNKFVLFFKKHELLARKVLANYALHMMFYIQIAMSWFVSFFYILFIRGRDFWTLQKKKWTCSECSLSNSHVIFVENGQFDVIFAQYIRTVQFKIKTETWNFRKKVWDFQQQNMYMYPCTSFSKATCSPLWFAYD